MAESMSEKTSIGEGAWFGCAVGFITGAILGLSAIIIPGVGPVISLGPIMALLGGFTGGIIGAVTGVITGAVAAYLMGLDFPEPT